jgi:hypothetical protein
MNYVMSECYIHLLVFVVGFRDVAYSRRDLEQVRPWFDLVSVFILHPLIPPITK